MPNTREKLIELLCQVQDYGTKHTNEQWSVTVETKCNETIADHLIANGVTVQKWIPVAERLPEEDGQYLVFQKHTYGTYTAVLQFAKDGRKVDKYDFHRGWKNVWYRYDSEWGYITIDNVTHWMPLPEAPKGE
jgi:hypothetical protein